MADFKIQLNTHMYRNMYLNNIYLANRVINYIIYYNKLINNNMNNLFMSILF